MSPTTRHPPCPPAVLELVERFDRHLDAYRSGRYNETQLRVSLVEQMLALHEQLGTARTAHD